MFNEDIRVKEPNKYPTGEVRAAFDEKLDKEIKASYANFDKSYKRTGISISEIVFSLSKGLNLDATKTAYMVLKAAKTSSYFRTALKIQVDYFLHISICLVQS